MGHQFPLPLACLAAVLLATSALAQEIDNPYKIPLKTGPLTPLPLTERDPTNPLSEQKPADEAAPADTERMVIQFNSVPGKAEINELRSQGIQLQEYIGGNSYFAVGVSNLTNDIQTLSDNIRAVQPITASQKIHPDLTHVQSNEPAEALGEETRTVTIELFEDVDIGHALQRIESLPSVVVATSRAAWSLTATVKVDLIDDLAGLDEVKFIEPAPPPRKEFNDGVRAAIGADIIQRVEHLAGAGVTVGIWDGGTIAAHKDFVGRLKLGDPSASVSSHATHVAGTLAGDGKGSVQAEPDAELMLLASQREQSSPAMTNASATDDLQSTEEELLELIPVSVLDASPEKWRGVAPGASIISYFWDNAADDHEKAIGEEKIAISQNSWGFSVDEQRGNCALFGDYTAEARAYDRIITGLFGARIPIVFAAGNERNDADCGMNSLPPFTNFGNITPPQTAKNVIAIGAINSDDGSMTDFSSWGPTDDGRIKPDVVTAGCENAGDHTVTSSVPANTYGGMCGTSMAAPAASGAIAILMEEHSKTANHPQLLPSSYRALLIHGAKDIDPPGPDFRSGFGRIDLVNSVGILRKKALTEAIIEETGSRKVAILPVPANATGVKVTLVWDDEPAATNALISLVNDLDLQIFSPTNEPKLPYLLIPSNPSRLVTNGTDHINVIEQVVVANPVEGPWRIEISGGSVPVPPQRFSLIVTVE